MVYLGRCREWWGKNVLKPEKKDTFEKYPRIL